MNKNAETVQITPEDYYDFIDHLRKLNAAQRLKKAEKLIDDPFRCKRWYIA